MYSIAFIARDEVPHLAAQSDEANVRPRSSELPARFCTQAAGVGRAPPCLQQGGGPGPKSASVWGTSAQQPTTGACWHTVSVTIHATGLCSK